MLTKLQEEEASLCALNLLDASEMANFQQELQQNPSLQSLVHNEKEQLVKQARKILPFDQKKVIELAFFSGLKQTEIAVHLKEALGTIKARIRRGMLRLREPLTQLREA